MRLDSHAPLGAQPDIRSVLYMDAWLRLGDLDLPLPTLPFWRRPVSPRGYSRISDPALWLPLSCAVTLVQHKSDSSTSGALSISFASTPTAGNALFAVVGSEDFGADHGPPSYSGATNSLTNDAYLDADSALQGNISIWSRLNCAGSATTYQFTPAGAGVAVAIFEYSGIATSGAFDQTAGAKDPGFTASADSGATGTIAQADELLLGGIFGGTTSVTLTAGTGWTTEEGPKNTTAKRLYALDQIVGSVTTYHLTGTWGSAVGWGALIATYKAASSGASITYPQLERLTRGLLRGMPGRVQ